MIRILKKSVADKIAAGEVIDRPLSIVKELVENSIDAGASSITIEIQKGGKSYIRVTDDGCGISAEEAELAFQRHATSKITTDKDLQHIDTLGFRGEALASITAVSRTELLTKTREEKVGTKLVVEGSQVAQKIAAGCPDGTTIIVRDLFYNTPARLKFMKSDATESRFIIDFVSQVALAYTEIKIRLVNNKNMLFTTQGKGDRYKNIITIYSKDIGEGLIPLNEEQEDIRLEGYISDPGKTRPTRKNQIFFINGRVVHSKVIEKGIDQAYSDKLFEGRHPVAFLFLHTDPANLDVNIHPNKREVRFHDEVIITQLVKNTIRNALQTKDSIPAMKQESVYSLKQDYNKPQEIQKKEAQVDIKKLLSGLREEQELPNLKPVAMQEEVSPFEPEKKKIKPLPQTVPLPPKPFDFDQLTITGAIFGTYITAIDETCFYLIDQHAAHERVFFEQLVSQYKQQETARQSLLTPVIFHVSYSVAEDRYSWLDALNQMGFTIEAFGPKTYIIKEMPVFLDIKEGEQFVQDFIDNMEDNINLESFPALEKIITRACKSAVKANDYLSQEEIQHLINDLKSCENPFSCPHGRPTFIKMTRYEIEKMFSRV